MYAIQEVKLHGLGFRNGKCLLINELLGSDKIA